MELQTLRHFGASRGSFSMFWGPGEVQPLSSEIVVFQYNGRFSLRGVVFSDVGLCEGVLLAFLEGRKSDAILNCDFGSIKAVE